MTDGSTPPLLGRDKTRMPEPARCGLADLSPAYFAVVMATGIVSLASYVHGLQTIAITLFAINIAAWTALFVLNVVRVVRHSKRYFADMVDHLRGPGYFT